MIAAAHQAGGRVAERDALLIMMAYRHGLRVSELAGDPRQAGSDN